MTDQTLNFTLNVEEANVILAALQELPYKVADPVIRNIINQAHEQTNPEYMATGEPNETDHKD